MTHRSSCPLEIIDLHRSINVWPCTNCGQFWRVSHASKFPRNLFATNSTSPSTKVCLLLSPTEVDPKMHFYMLSGSNGAYAKIKFWTKNHWQYVKHTQPLVEGSNGMDGYSFLKWRTGMIQCQRELYSWVRQDINWENVGEVVNMRKMKLTGSSGDNQCSWKSNERLKFITGQLKAYCERGQSLWQHIKRVVSCSWRAQMARGSA